MLCQHLDDLTTRGRRYSFRLRISLMVAFSSASSAFIRFTFTFSASSSFMGLIRFGGHLPKGEYDVDHDGHEGQADAAELHG